VDIRKVKKLIELLEESGISELEISEGEESVRISRHPRMTMQAPTAAPALHSASAPGAKPFVEIGMEIKVGQVLCIIEAMKMMNQIESDKAGRVTAILAKNGEPVEFGQPLFIVE
jgi:acetyl-CoA carboxylase biotin carboxyl carrier protein